MQPSRVILTGGGAQNLFNVRHVQATLRTNHIFTDVLVHGENGDHNTIAAGGMDYWHGNAPSVLPDSLAFYVVCSQEFDRRRHDDVVNWEWRRGDDEQQTLTRPRHRSNNIHRSRSREAKFQWHWKPDPDKTFYDIWSPNTLRVPNRLVPIYSIEPGQNARSHLVPMEFDIEEVDGVEPRLRIPLYSSVHKNKAHKPLFRADGSQQPGVKGWPISYAKLPKLEQWGFQPEKASNGKKYYNVLGGVRIVQYDDHLVVEIELYGPGQKLAFQTGQPLSSWPPWYVFSLIMNHI